MRPILSILQHPEAMVELTPPSTPYIYTLTMGPGYEKIWSFLGSLRCVVPLPWFIRVYVMMLDHQYGTYIKCAATLGSNGQTHMTIDTMHILPDYYGPGLLCKNLVLAGLGCFKLCLAITMAQGHYNDVGASIWDQHQVCYNTEKQCLNSHDSQHHIYIP